jgi:hypothetical protein
MIVGLTIQIVAEHYRLRYILGPESCIVSPNRAIEEFRGGFDRVLRATRREDRYE